jgi:hypothetical protein
MSVSLNVGVDAAQGWHISIWVFDLEKGHDKSHSQPTSARRSFGLVGMGS